MKPDVVVVGAGAAGIFASLRAAELGAKVLLLEKTARIGTKILISGGGKCNIAHEGPIEDVLKAFRPNEARFLRPSVYRLPNRAIIEFFTSRGLEVYTRPDMRVFPVHQTAKDVVEILRRELRASGVRLCLNTPVREILRSEGRVAGVRTGQPKEGAGAASIGAIRPGFGAKALLAEVLASVEDDGAALEPQDVACASVVVCVGGSSYPNSGTTGDGYPWVKAMGHQMVKVRPSLAPIALAVEGAADRAGVALRDVVLKARQNGKEACRWRGDLLFTHQGVSGPTVLGISRVAAELAERGPVELEVDAAPDKGFEQLQQELIALGAASPNRGVAGWVEEALPSRLVATILGMAGIDAAVKMGKLAKKDRNRLVEVLKGWKLGPVKSVILEKGECVAGGVALEEVDPQTMASRRVPGLFLCGEILDVAGPVGGYNLQAAFSTGWVAGESAAQSSGAGRAPGS